MASTHDATVDAVAIAAALQHPFVDVVLSGAATVAQLRSNVAAQDLDLRPEELDALGDLAEEPEGYWSTRSRLAWT
jgi:aryl-alcohol dehydrogenase-like predicted oxidoreductase